MQSLLIMFTEDEISCVTQVVETLENKSNLKSFIWEKIEESATDVLKQTSML